MQLAKCNLLHVWILHFLSSFPCSLCPGRDAEKLDYITRYLKAVAMFRDYSNSSQDPDFTQVLYSTVDPSQTLLVI